MQMREIIDTLSKIDLVTQQLVEESYNDMDLEVAITSKITENSITIQKYRIDIILNEFASKQKKFYNIVDTTNNEIIYEHLGLFETAKGIVKKLLSGSNTGSQELRQIKLLDDAYSNALYEVWMYKNKASTGINEDVMIAKMSNAKHKLQETKRKILKNL